MTTDRLIDRFVDYDEMTVSELSDEEVIKFKNASSNVAQKFIQTCVNHGFSRSNVEAIVAAFN
jgi:hypothetical protein